MRALSLTGSNGQQIVVILKETQLGLGNPRDLHFAGGNSRSEAIVFGLTAGIAVDCINCRSDLSRDLRLAAACHVKFEFRAHYNGYTNW